MFFHDILNTASGLRGLAEMMGKATSGASTPLLAGVQALSAQIVEEIQLRRDLLHAEHGSLVLDNLQADTHLLVENSLRHYQMRAESSQITVEVTPGPDIRIQSDPERVQRVLGILIKNAIEASGVGDVVRVSSAATAEQWSVSVHNTAVIPPEIAESIGRRGCSSRGAGRGVGLYMARLLLEQYLGGALEWSSSDKDGTTFTARFPIADASQDASVTSPEHPQSINCRVLLVDDNAVNRKVASVMLKRLGIAHDTAGNGQEAIDLFSAHAYDLILMDCMMPQIDGFEATRRIRALQKSTTAGENSGPAVKRIPIIAMTAHTATEDLDSCREAGMDDYIAKPMTLPALQALLGKWVPPQPEVEA